MSNDKNSPATPALPSNFLRAIVESDLAAGTHTKAGMPSVITRFPPEPNGYLHVGHAKSICLNFGLARDYQGRCNLRFDDTNPEKEEQEYVDTIKDSVEWLGFSWDYPSADGKVEHHLHYASDYFEQLYQMAEYLIQQGVPRASFVSVSGMGESQPVADNKTADGRAQNRRTEIKIVR